MAGQCRGLCVYNHGLKGHKCSSTVIVFYTLSEFLGCHRHQADVKTNTGNGIGTTYLLKNEQMKV